jgi:hypothetical protein
MNNIFANFTTPQSLSNNHTLTEIQRRLLFASHFKRVLASGENFADQKRNKMKSLDDYYSIRAQVHSTSKIFDDGPPEVPKELPHKQKLWIVILIALLSVFWLSWVASMLGSVP